MNALSVKDDILRNQALEQYEVVNPATDPILDEIARLAAQVCETSIAFVCLVTQDRLLLKARYGFEAQEVSLGSLPCEVVIQGDTIYSLPDARLQPDFSPDGIHLESGNFRFYAAAPLATPEGVNIGTLAVMDHDPRQLTQTQTDALGILGKQVITRLELNGRIRQMDRAARSQRRIESALTVERNFVSAVLDTVGALVAVFDTAGRIVRFNRACEIASGYDFATLVGRYPWDHLIPRQEIPEAIETFESLCNGTFPATLENHWLNRDGSIRRIAWAATALKDAQDQVAFIIATGIDVTTQRAAELTLRESEARYRQLVEGSLGMVFTHDMRGSLLSVNGYGAEAVGRTVEEMIGSSLDRLVAVDRRRGIDDYLINIADSGEAQGMLYLEHTDGDTRVIAYRNKLIDTPGRTPYVLGFGVDITEQVRTEGRLRTLTRQSDSILESVGDGIYCLDFEGKVTVVNSAAAKMLGYRQEEMLGRVMHHLIHHTRATGSPYPSEESPILRRLFNFITARVTDEVFWRKDGSCFPVEYVARPLMDTNTTQNGEARAIGVVVAFTDMTERRALNRMKDEFISTVSHELRTPLTSLRGALGLLAGGALGARPEKAQQMLDIAISNTDRLARLVNDILDLERIQSGKIELHYTFTTAEYLMRRAIGAQQSHTPQPNAQFFYAANGVTVWADPDRILQVFGNLLSNAIKFSPSGGEIHLSVHNLDDQEAHFEISDKGQGIDEDKLENIFDRFQQGDASDTRTLGGTGIGLAICRSIINQHGGRIWATSIPGKGTTFHFTLPTTPRTNLR